MDPRRRQRITTLRRVAGLLVLVAATVAVAVTAAAAQEALPPALVASLESDRSAAEARLAQERRRLAAAVRSQRAAAARRRVVERRAQMLRGVAEAVGLELPEALDRAVTRVVARQATAEEAADEALLAATGRTSRAQADALDADRRLRALQRASATADERDPGIGSWRFGSGGPPVSAESIDRYLATKGSPLAGQGAAFLESGVEHEVDPRLVVAIAGAESYFGIVTCADFNAWGWGCPTRPFRFRSWAEGIDTVTRGLREGYLDDGLTSVGEIHLRYAPPNAANDPTGLNFAWPDNVARFLVEQGGDPQDVAGVLGPSR